jgi:hypothetical protein
MLEIDASSWLFYAKRTLPVLLVAEVFYLTMLSAATVNMGHCGKANDSGEVKYLERMLFMYHLVQQNCEISLQS